MTATAPPGLRVVSFGDLEGDVWGAAVDAGHPAIAFATPDGPGSASELSITGDDGPWRLSGEGVELSVRAGDGADGQAAREQQITGELCHVSGTLTVAGHERTVECLGNRNTGADLDLRRLGSLRGLAGWFDVDHGLAVLALRRAGSKGHADDLVAATVVEPDGVLAVDDPRLSTTFDAGGQPTRASVELWIGEGEEQFLRRAAAEARGATAAALSDGLRLEVTPLLCHTRGIDGTGVYLLAQLQ